MDKDALKYVLSDQRQEAASLLEGAVSRRPPAGAAGRPAPRLATVITGVRRCGKSVFAHQLCGGAPYVSLDFDDERLAAFGTGDFDAFLQAANELEPGVRTLLLDEVQNVPAWELFVNRALRKGYRCVVTGSNARLLSRELATHLTGRTSSLELYPFSFAEFLAAKGASPEGPEPAPPERRAALLRLFDAHLDAGGFPEAALAGAGARYLRELYRGILLRDVAARLRLREARTLQEVALYAVSSAGSRLTYQRTARGLGLRSVSTVKKYLEALEEAYLVFPVPPHSAKPKEILRQARKVYPIDLGLLSALTLKSTPDRGTRLEAFVFLELKRRGHEVYTVQEPSFEVDFLLREGRRTAQLIQVCWGLSDPETRERELRALARAARLKGCRDLLILTYDEDGELSADGVPVRVRPAWRWALEAR